MDSKYIHSLVAKLYFSEMKTKIQIAKELNISRFKVARLINEAIEQEYVQFIFPKQKGIDDKISLALCEKFNLSATRVLSITENFNTKTSLNEKLGKIAADYLSDIIKKDMNLGVAWGNVLSNVVNKLVSLPPINVVQLSGVHPGIKFTLTPIDLIHKIATISNGTAYPLYIPLWVEHENLAKQLANDDTILDTMKFYDHLDVVITGIGSWDTQASGLYNIIPIHWKELLVKQGIAADVCISFIDYNGKIISNEIGDLSLGISAEQLFKTKKVIGVAGGTDKFTGILAALKSGILNVLITDYNTAIKLLDT